MKSETAPLRPEELFAQWQRGQWASVYLFAGQEDFLIEQALGQATAHWLGDAKDSLNLDRFDGESAGAQEILDACRTAPFLGGGRLVRVDQAAKLSTADQERLAESLACVPSDTGLILIWGKEWRREESKKPLMEAAMRHGHVVIFWPLFPEQAQRWVRQRASHYKKEIATEAAAWLVENVGEGLRLLDQELAKLSQYVGANPRIALEDVQASFGYEKLGSPFDWVAAVRRKDSAAAARLLKRLLEEGEEPLRLLALISRPLRDWLSVKNSGENAAMIAMRFRLKRGEETQFLKDLGRWSEKDLIAALNACLETEQSIKSGKETAETALSLLALDLCGLQAAYAFR